MSNLEITRRWLRRAVSPYVHQEIVYDDVDATLLNNAPLRPKTDVYTYDDGRIQMLLCIHGLLPINYKGASYNIPVAVWVPLEYPKDPPLVYVVPTSDMLVKAGKFIDVSGKCSVPYMQNWERKTQGSNLRDLLRLLQDQFSREPPLYAKPPPGAMPPNTGPAPPPTSNAPAPPPRPPPGPYQAFAAPSHQPPPQQQSYASPIDSAVRPPPPTPAYYTPLPQTSVPQHPPQQHLPQQPPIHHASQSGPQPQLLSHQAHIRSSSLASPFPASPIPSSPMTGPALSVQPRADHRRSHLPQGQYGPNATPSPQPWVYQPQLHPPPPQPAYATPQPVQPPLQELLQPRSVSAPQPNLMDGEIPESIPAAPAAPLPPRPLNPELLRLHDQVLYKVNAEISTLGQSFSVEAERLRAMQTDLLSGEPAIRDEMGRLEAVRDVCRAVAGRLKASVDKGESNVQELKRKGDPDVDELICSTTIVFNQLINLVAEDNAIEDTIYHLHRALNSGRIDLERFLRTTRVLAEQQFMKRALIEKITAGIPIGMSMGWT